MAKKESYLKSAQKFLVKGQLDRAIKEYYKAIEADPRDYRVRHKLGELLARQGNRGEAINELGTVAKSYAKDGFDLKAIAVYKQMIKLKPDLYDVHLKLGDLYHQLSLMSDAAEHYKLVADYYEVEGTARDCIEVFRRIVELNPDDTHSKLKLAEYHVREGENESALKLYYDVASVLQEKNRTDDLVRVYERLIQLDPSRLETYKALAELYLQIGEPKRALAKLQICFKADSSDETTLKLLGEAFLALNQIPKAKSVFKELARIYAYQGFPEKQREVYERIYRMDSNDPDAIELLFGGRKPDGTSPREGVSASTAAPVVATPVVAPVAEPSRDKVAPRPEKTADSTVPSPREVTRDTRHAESLTEIPAHVTKLMAEADVYLEYGLLEKASSHLASVVEKAPTCYVARKKYRDLLIKRGRKGEAAAESAEMSMLASEAGAHEQAIADLSSAVELDPANLQYQHALASLRRMVPAPPTPPEPVQHYKATSDAEIEIEEDDSYVSLSQSLLSPALQEEVELVDDGGEESQSIYLTLTGTDVQFVGVESTGGEEGAGGIEGANVGSVTHLDAHEAVVPAEPLSESGGSAAGTEEHAEGLESSKGAEGIFSDFLEETELVEDEEGALDIVSEIESELVSEDAAQQVHERSSALELARAYYELGMYDEALTELAKVGGDESDEASAIWLKGRCHLQKGNLDEAIRLFQATLNRTDLSEMQELSVLYDLGLAYEAKGNYTLALDLFDEIYSINEHFRHREVGMKLAELSARVPGRQKGSIGSAR